MSKRAKRTATTKIMDTDSFDYEIVCKAPPVPSGEAPQNGRNKRKVETRPSTTITLSIPTQDEECPLTLDKISQSKLEFLPDVTFCKDKPHHTKLTLPCGHSFSAMVLIYNWCKNNMTCPYCRSGHTHRADTNFLPHHFSSQMASHIQTTLQSERERDEQLEMSDLFTISRLSIPFDSLAFNGNLSLRVEFFDIPAQSERPARPIFTSNSNLIPFIDLSDAGPSFMPRGQLRTISHIMHMGVNHIKISVRVNMGREQMVIDNSPMINIQQVENNKIVVDGIRAAIIDGEDRLVRGGGVQVETPTKFEIRFNRSMLSAQLHILDNVLWRPGSERLEIMSVGF